MHSKPPLAHAEQSAVVASALNDLVRTCLDGAHGLAMAARLATNVQLRTWLEARSLERDAFADELQREVLGLGASPASSGSSLGDLHRTIMGLEAAAGAEANTLVTEACLFGEGRALELYDRVVETTPWQNRCSAHSVVVAQRDRIKEGREHLKAMSAEITRP